MIIVNIIHIGRHFSAVCWNILISGGAGAATFTATTAILRVFWVYAKRTISLRQCSVRETVANIIKCSANISLSLSYPSLFCWLSLCGSAQGREGIDLPKWAAISRGESPRCLRFWMGIAHFTWAPCLARLKGSPARREWNPAPGLGGREIRPRLASATGSPISLSIAFSLALSRFLFHVRSLLLTLAQLLTCTLTFLMLFSLILFLARPLPLS